MTYVIKQLLKSGELWTSEPFEGDERHAAQNVTAGYISGEPRWAEDVSGHCIYKLDANGKPVSYATTYTTADADYDWAWTKHLAVVGKDQKGHAIRRVETESQHAQAQRSRYLSGLHMAVDEAEWQKLVAFKLVEVA